MQPAALQCSRDMREALITAGAALNGDWVVADCSAQEDGPVLRGWEEHSLPSAHRSGLHALHHGRWLPVLHPLIADLVEILFRFLLALEL